MAKVLGSVAITAPQLLDQKVANDTSDYLWYIISGVQLVSQKDGTEVAKDISTSVWSYKVGMHGENMKLYSPGIIEGWFANGLPTDKIFMWYKNPFEVKIASVTIAKACAKVYEGHALELACKENQVISEIKFASFGVPKVNVDPLRRVIVNLVILYLM
ncbi:hypothetical protein JHK85_046141 [Glycine max]|nr:hypothetical protein JHK85_046141 [Glycine max]